MGQGQHRRRRGILRQVRGNAAERETTADGVEVFEFQIAGRFHRAVTSCDVHRKAGAGRSGRVGSGATVSGECDSRCLRSVSAGVRPLQSLSFCSSRIERTKKAGEAGRRSRQGRQTRGKRGKTAKTSEKAKRSEPRKRCSIDCTSGAALQGTTLAHISVT